MKKYIIVLLSIIWAGLLHAQTNSNYLNGRITGTKFSAGSKIEFLLFNPNHINVSLVPDTVLTAIIDSDGKFSLKYIPPYPLFYMGLDFYNSADSLLNLRKEFLIDPFICEVGDSVALDLKILSPNKNGGVNNKGWFKGKGSDKYNAQYLINHYEYVKEERGPYYNSGPFSTDEPIVDKEKFYLLQQQHLLNIADTYIGIVPDTILTHIKNNIMAMSKYRFTKSYLKDEYAEGRPKAQQSVVAFVNMPQQQGGLFTRTDELIGARGYTDFILLADELSYRIKHKINLNSDVKMLPLKEYAAWMYSNLKNNYSGTLRESLLTRWLTDESELRKYFYYLEAIIPEAKNLMKQASNKALLNKIAEQSKGKKAFSFKFIDQTGKVHTLSDYKDKILVLDFWFTGCSGCTQIPPVMKTIMDELKPSKDVVFLSISVDTSIKWWEYGLSTALYTLPSQIHLKTIERGRRDPFILNYRINSYPKIMVIGKKGLLLAANPIDPRLDKGKDVVDMIKRELKK